MCARAARVRARVRVRSACKSFRCAFGMYDRGKSMLCRVTCGLLLIRSHHTYDELRPLLLRRCGVGGRQAPDAWAPVRAVMDTREGLR